MIVGRIAIAFAVLASVGTPAAAKAQDEPTRIIVNSIHANHGAVQSISIAGTLDGFGEYEVKLDKVTDEVGTSIEVTSSFGPVVRFTLGPEWIVEHDLPSVFERDGEIWLLVPIISDEGRCGLDDERYGVHLPLNYEEQAEIFTLFGCEVLKEPVAVERR